MRNSIPFLPINHREKGSASPVLPIILLATILLIALAGWAIIHFAIPLYLQNKQIPVASPAISPDAQAAIAGVSAFYTIDYSESADQWAERVCATTTDEGCLLAKGYYASAIHATAEKYSIRTSCTVLPVTLVDNDETHMLRVWKMQVTLSNPWPMINQTQAVYVAVAYDEKNQAWEMQHVLFDQEAQKYNNTPTP